MSEMNDVSTTPAPAGRWIPRRREYWIAGFAVSALAAASIVVPGVLAHRGFTAGGLRGFTGGLQDPARARARASFAVEWALKAVDGTPAQQEQARLVIDRAIDQLLPIASRHRDDREAMARELSKPQVDREALEELRLKEMDLADEASRVGMAAVADLAELLTPAQRTELLDLAHRFHEGEGSR